MKKYRFSCGCEFAIEDKHVVFVPDIDEIPLDCQRTWGLISEGDCKGVFQLDSSFGKSYAKKLKPETIEHLAALGAILRPGSSEAYRDGKSVTDHYIDRKNGQEAVTYFHPSLEPILKDTYGEMIYQEQATLIAQQLAGFDLAEADSLRKAIGKKKADLMAKMKDKFLKGCKKVGILTEDEAEQIFGWIEKSQRYSFNKSHAVSYAMIGYLSAYAKAHFPKHFFKANLMWAHKSPNPLLETKELVYNAKNSYVEVEPPNFPLLNSNFEIIDGKIYFGLENVKGIGQSNITQMQEYITKLEPKLGKPRSWTWLDFLIYLAPNVNKAVVRALIASGSLQHIPGSRRKKLLEFDTFIKLTDNEIKKIIKHKEERDVKFDSVTGILQYAVDNHEQAETRTLSNVNRLKLTQGWLQTLEHPPYDLEDSAEWVSGIEKSLMGLSISCTSISSYDTSSGNTNCRDLNSHVVNKSNNFILPCTVEDIREVKTKKGKNPGQKMAFLAVSDDFGYIDSLVIFPNVWLEVKPLLTLENNIILVLQKSKNSDSYIVMKVQQL